MSRTTLRASLLAGTALMLPCVALAQAPNAQPQGGQVVAGSAVIDQGTAGRTRIVQSTDRAAVDWRSFDIGRDHVVQFQQPASTSVTLNRVTGPDPSAIAGRIQANGQVAIVNQSGVVFLQGSQVDAAGLVVSTANMANQAFMRGGRLVFDQPGRADARIENHGEISVRDAGLAALVAPQVANRGRITARMGRVVLAGAETHAVDLHGDGLLSLEILSPVRTRPANGEALVTNTGAITATGGTVVLTAAAVDGIVQDLVRAGGQISAETDPATGRTGRVLVAGTGGAVRVEGEVSASGTAANSRGGTVEIIGDRTWLAPGAVVDASGRAGGGTINIGTTRTQQPHQAQPHQAQPHLAQPRLAQRTGIAARAVVRADATQRGDGGRVVVNSSDYTAHAGEISASGGPQGGNGGFVEVSGQQGLSIPGQVRVNAGLGGLAGTFLIDPINLTIVADGDPSVNVTPGDIAGGVLGQGAPPDQAFLAAGSISGFVGNLVLEATNNITLASAVDKPTGDLSLSAGRNIFINAPLVLRAGNLVLISELSISGIGSQINALVQVPAANRVTLTGSAIQTGGGRILAGTLNFTGNPSSIDLGGANQIAVIENMPGGFINRVRTIGDLRVNGTIGRLSGNSFTRIDVENGSLTVAGNILADNQSNTTVNILARASGNIVLLPGSQVVGNPGSTGTGLGVRLQAGFDFAAGAVNPLAPGGISLAGVLAGGSPSLPLTSTTAAVDLGAGQGGIVQTGGQFRATTLTAQSGGDALLNVPGNRLDVIGPSDVVGDLSLTIQRTGAIGVFDINLDGAINVGRTLSVTVLSNGSLRQRPGSVITVNRLDAAIGSNGLTLDGANRIVELGTVVAETPLFIRNAGPLRLVGLVSGRNNAVRLEVAGDLDVLGTILARDGVDLRSSGSIRLGAGSALRVEPFNGGPGVGAVINLRAGFDFTSGTVNLASPTGITIAGTIGNPAQLVPINLAAGTAGMVQTSGRVIGSTLDVSSGGSATLDRASAGTPNSIQQLNSAVVTGDFVLDNGTSNLLVREPSSAANYSIRTAGNVVVQSDIVASSRASFRVGSLSVPAPIFDPTGPVPGGTVTAPLVEVAPWFQRAVLLPVSPAQLPIAGELLLNNATLSRISASTLRVGATTFDGVLATTAASVDFPASFAFQGALDLRAIGNISQDAGTTLSAGRLTGAAGGAFTLANPTNILPQIADVSAGTTLALRTTGNQVLNGALLAPSVSLTTGGSLAQSGAGRIGNGLLTLQVAGDAILGGANTITVLAASSVGSGLLLRNASPQLSVPAGSTVFTGGTLDVAQTGDFVVDGTVSGTATSLSATGRLQVNGNSAIARTGALGLASSIFGLNGLLQAATGIDVNATSQASFSGQAVAPVLRVFAPQVNFSTFDASGALVSLFLGAGGSTSGTLDARGLSVFGGSGAALFGTIGGVPGEPAAAIGRRGTSGGLLLSEPLPQQNAFLFNNCAIGVAICRAFFIPPQPLPPPGAPPLPPLEAAPQLPLGAPPEIFFDLFGFQSLFGIAALGRLSPPILDLTLRPGRDRSEEADLAPPNIRSEDF